MNEECDQLIMCKSISECVQKFRKGIRKAEIEKIKAARRKELLQQVSRQQLLDSFNAPANKNLLTLSTIFQNCQSIILSSFSSNTSLIDEKYTLPISLHVQLLRKICQDLSSSCKEGDYTCLDNFIYEMMKRYSAAEIHKEIEYEVEYYNLVYYSLDRLTVQTKNKLINWVQTKESLWVVTELIAQCEEVSCSSHPHLFKMIQEGLTSGQNVYQIDAAILLAKIIKYYDQRDLLYILEDFEAIPHILIQIVDLRVAKQRYNSLIDFWSPLLFLFQTFDEALLVYLKSGIVSICSNMIASNDPACIFGGLQILNRFCQIKNEAIKEALLYDEEMDESKMWLDNCLKNNVIYHENISIRRSCARLVRTLLKSVNIRQLQEISKRFMNRGESLLTWLQAMLNEKDNELLISGLQCVQRLLYNEQAVGEDHLGNILNSLQYTSIPSLITQLELSQNVKIREICGDLTDRISQISKTLAMDQL